MTMRNAPRRTLGNDCAALVTIQEYAAPVSRRRMFCNWFSATNFSKQEDPSQGSDLSVAYRDANATRPVANVLNWPY